MYSKNAKDGKRLSLKILVMIGVILIVQCYFFLNYRILANENDISKMKIEVTSSKYVYSGKKKTPNVNIYDGKTKLKKDKDYTVKYKNNISTGKATILIDGKNNYTGSATKSFYIVPKATKIKSVLLNKKSTSATIKWKKDSQASGYAIYMSTSENGKYEKIKVIKNNNETTYIKKGLKSKKCYYFKIKSFVTVDGKRIYSDLYSKPRSNTGLHELY